MAPHAYLGRAVEITEDTSVARQSNREESALAWDPSDFVHFFQSSALNHSTTVLPLHTVTIVH